MIQVMQPTQALHKSSQGHGLGRIRQNPSTPPLATTMSLYHTLLPSRLQLGYRMELPICSPYSFYMGSTDRSRGPKAVRALLPTSHGKNGQSLVVSSWLFYRSKTPFTKNGFQCLIKVHWDAGIRTTGKKQVPLASRRHSGL